jgi:Sulfotransferase family
VGAPTPPPVPFLVGSGRSGTTLLRIMFDSHPDLAVPPEAFFPTGAPQAWRFADGKLDIDRAVAGLSDEPWFADWDLPEDGFADAVAAARPTSYADVLRCLFHSYADEHRKPRYGSKTPQHVLSIAQLAALFPESRFIHIVRDGRDVAASFTQVHFGPSDLASATRLWAHRVSRGRAAGASLGEDRYLECRLEDLLADLEGTLRAMCTFVDLPYDDAMLRYHERDPMTVAGVGDRYYHQNAMKPPTEGLRDWRTQMSRSDVLLVEAIAGDTLERFGYERATITPTAGDRLRLGARKGVAEVRRRNHAVRRVRGAVGRRLHRA